MFRVLADVQCLQGKDPERGIPRWALGFVDALRKHDCIVVGLTNSELPDISSEADSYFDQVVHNTRENIRKFADSIPCVYLILSVFEPVRPLSSLLPLHIIDSRAPIAVVMYDLTPYLFTEEYERDSQDLRILELKKKLFRYVDRFLCISNNTRSDLISLWGVEKGQTVVVGSGISPFFFSAEDDSHLLEKIGINRNFVFCVGRNDPRKKTKEFIGAFAKLKTKYKFESLQLVITCQISNEVRKDWTKFALDVGLTETDLVLTGVISDELLRVLYSNCQLFVEPSIYEGFGYPPAEAAACGAVVLTSNTSSFPEVIENPEAMFDPLNRDQIVELMHTALIDTDFRERNMKLSKQSVAKHNWERVSAKGLEVLSAISKPIGVPTRLLGDLSSITDKSVDEIKISKAAVKRFFSEDQFDLVPNNKRETV